MSTEGTKENHRQATASETDYDKMPYFCSSFSQTHPNRLATIATLFGMSPAPVNKCRVLELGCGTGGNLIPMAYGLPDSEFVGVDLSAKEIQSANEYMNALALKNIQFKHANIMDIDASYGKFDYIIAHGVYSWVPKEVQEKLLSIYRENLQPQGVAYVSYNVYPGWHFYNMVREMMRYHIRNIKNIPEAVQAARQFLADLEMSVPDNKVSYKEILKQEMNRIKKFAKDDYIWHDMLAELNDPYYFHQFNQQVTKAGLQYLADADFYTMMPGNFNAAALQFIQQMGVEDIVQIEQYMDFVRNRSFRESLVCHRDVVLNREIETTHFTSFYYTTFLRPLSDNPDIRSNNNEEFVDQSGNKIISNNPSVKASWCYMASRGPQPVSFSELVDGIQTLLGNDHVIVENVEETEKTHKQITDHLWWCYSQGLIRIYTQSADMNIHPGERPLASPIARYEAKHQLLITNQIHERVEIDNLTHHILPLLDGKHDRNAIVAALNNLLVNGKISIQEAGKPVTDKTRVRQLLTQRMESIVKRCAQVGLLI